MKTTGPEFNQASGKEGQLSTPEQNEIVAELAGASPTFAPRKLQCGVWNFKAEGVFLIKRDTRLTHNVSSSLCTSRLDAECAK